MRSVTRIHTYLHVRIHTYAFTRIYTHFCSVLKWELAADPQWKYDKGDKWDVILAADVTYYSKNIPPLTRMIQRLAGTHAHMCIV